MIYTCFVCLALCCRARATARRRPSSQLSMPAVALAYPRWRAAVWRPPAHPRARAPPPAVAGRRPPAPPRPRLLAPCRARATARRRPSSQVSTPAAALAKSSLESRRPASSCASSCPRDAPHPHQILDGAPPVGVLLRLLVPAHRPHSLASPRACAPPPRPRLAGEKARA